MSATSVFGPSPLRRRTDILLRQLDALLVGFVFRQQQADRALVRIEVSRRPKLELYFRSYGVPEIIAVLLGGTRVMHVYQLPTISRRLDFFQTVTTELFVDLQGNLFYSRRVYDRATKRFRWNINMRVAGITRDKLVDEHLLARLIDSLTQLS